MRAPQDEVPVVLPLAAVLAQTEHVALVLTDVRVHREGVELGVDRMLRRGELDDEAWWAIEPRFSGHFRGGPMPSVVAPLRFGLELADGTRVVDEGVPHFRPPAEDLPHDAFTVARTGGGGGGGEEFRAMRDGLWLYPVPPAGPIALVLRWPDLGIAETRFEIAAQDWPSLASQARPVWPDSPSPGSGLSGRGWAVMLPSDSPEAEPDGPSPAATPEPEPRDSTS